MERLLKKYFWAVPYVVAVLCTFLLAKAVNHVLDGKILVPAALGKATTRDPRPNAKVSEPEAGALSKAPKDFITRNVFCKTCEPPAPPAPPTPTAPEPAINPDLPVPTSLPLTLVATSVVTAKGSESLSSATVENTQTRRLGLYRIDDDIPDAGKVVTVAPLFVDFRNSTNQRLERVSLVQSATPPRAPPAAIPAAPVQVTVAVGFQAELDAGVKEVGENSYEIARSLVDKVLGDPTIIATAARIVPSIKDGKANGFKLYAVRPNSVYAKLGLKNGDTLQAINGMDITSPDKVLEVYAKVKSASNLSISIARRGENQTLNYQIK